MAPGISWFISFNQHDPSTSDQCIYFTKKEGNPRCRVSCRASDNRRAIELHKTIIRLPAEAVDIELIKDYILCICCRFNNAQHRDRIVDFGLWTPLAVRWLGEIRSHARTARQFLPATPPPSYPPPSNSATSSRYRTPTSSINTTNTTPPTSVASSSAYQNTFPETPTRITPLTGFRPHIPEPGPADSVSSKIQDILEDRDFETGSLYIFDRDSSPGYVYISWTANPVLSALESWSNCGYTLNLLFRVDHVPHAQRAKTLTQYELINEWRRERYCEHCSKPHHGWFEVSKKRAKEVLGDWVYFMKIAEPYEWGVLKAQWQNFIKRTVDSGETVTAKKLLEHYELTLARDTTLVEGPVEPEDDLQDTSIGNGSNLNGDLAGKTAAGALPRTNFTSELESSGKTSVPSVSDSLSGTEPLSKIKPLHKDVPAERAPKPLRKDVLAKGASKPLHKGVPAERAPKPLHKDVPAERAPAEQIPPPSPPLRPVDSQDRVTELGPSPEIEDPFVSDVITKPNTSSAVTPSSESNPLISSATSPPRPKAKPRSSLPAPLVQEIPGGQGIATTPDSATQRVTTMLKKISKRVSLPDNFLKMRSRKVKE